MESVILVIHLILALAIILFVLLQRSEGGGLGIGGGSGGLGNLATAHGTANMLTRATAIAAGLFFLTSLILGVLATRGDSTKSVIDALDNPVPAISGVEGAAEAKEAPKEVADPQVPISE